MWRVSLVCVIALSMAPDAFAWQARWCYGEVSRWDAVQPTAMRVEARWGAPGTSWGEALRRGITSWNAGGALRRAFRWHYQAFDRFRSGDGINQVSVVRPERIDHALGLTRIRRDACFWGPWPRADRQMLEADVMIGLHSPAAMRRDPLPDCDRYARWADGREPLADAGYETTREATVLHELGHAVGLQHENHAMSLMMQSNGEGRYCGSPQFSPHPDDLTGLRALYGVDHRAPLTDIAAGVLRIVEGRPDEVRMLDNPGVVEGCPGDMFDVGWALANRGSGEAAFDIWWYASRSPAFDRVDDVLLGVDRAHRLAPGTYRDARKTLRISRGLTPDMPYYVGFLLVSHVADSHPRNNLGYSAIRLVRRGEESCR